MFLLLTKGGCGPNGSSCAGKRRRVSKRARARNRAFLVWFKSIHVQISISNWGTSILSPFPSILLIIGLGIVVGNKTGLAQQYPVAFIFYISMLCAKTGHKVELKTRTCELVVDKSSLLSRSWRRRRSDWQTLVFGAFACWDSIRYKKACQKRTWTTAVVRDFRKSGKLTA